MNYYNKELRNKELTHKKVLGILLYCEFMAIGLSYAELIFEILYFCLIELSLYLEVRIIF
jgi:hypothetical protein